MDARPAVNAAPRVFIRERVLILERPGRLLGVADVRAAPDAQEALRALRDYGCEVVVLRGDEPDERLVADDWLMTGDHQDCRWAHARGVHTVIVGGDGRPPDLQPERPDHTATSLLGAALEILTRSLR